MKKILAFLLAAVMLLSLAACGSEPAEEETPAPAESEAPSGEEPSGEEPSGEGEHEPVTLRVYVRYSDDDTILPYDYAVECLAEDMPWVTLELDPMPADDGVKLKSMVATGDMPDIFAVGSVDILDSMIEAGAVQDLTEEVTANGFVENNKESERRIRPGELESFPGLLYDERKRTADKWSGIGEKDDAGRIL